MRQHTNKKGSKTIKKPYSRSKAFDASCRNHGGCPWCERSRLHSRRKKEEFAKRAIDNYER